MSVKSNDELSKRKKLILKAIVEAHIADGEPVGSKYLLSNEHLTCSSATIRNEMAELEELGLIEKAKMNQLDQILLTASKLAGNLTNYTSFLIKPKASSVSIKRFDVIYLNSHGMLLVMISSGGNIITKQLSFEEKISQLTVTELSIALNDFIAGLTASEITLPIIMELEAAMGDKSGIISPIIKIIYESMNELDGGDLRVSGMDRLLQYPEYSNKEQLRELLTTLENKDDILDIVSDTDTDHDRVNVVIGSESSVKVMNNSAIVFKPIVRDGRTLGAIGIIGPRRMDYAKVVATIDELTDNVKNILNENNLINQASETNEGENNG